MRVVLLAVVMVIGLVGCEKSFSITESNLTRLRAWAFTDGYYEGHKDAIDGVAIDSYVANSKGDLYSTLHKKTPGGQ